METDDDHPPFKALATTLGDVQKNLRLASSKDGEERKLHARYMTMKLFGSYPNAKAHDQSTFTEAVERLFLDYPPNIVEYAVRVLPRQRNKYGSWDGLPSVAQITEILDLEHVRECRNAERQESEKRQLADRRAEDERRKARPSFDELRQQYGLIDPEQENQQAKLNERKRLSEANERTLMSEYQQAGIEPTRLADGTLISLSLLKNLGAHCRGDA